MAQPDDAMTEAEIRELIGDPEEFWQKREAFARSEQFFWDNHDRLLKEHPESWVGVYEEELRVADTLDALLEALDQAGIPRGETCVHFVTAEKRILIPTPFFVE